MRFCGGNSGFGLLEALAGITVSSIAIFAMQQMYFSSMRMNRSLQSSSDFQSTITTLQTLITNSAICGPSNSPFKTASGAIPTYIPNSGGSPYVSDSNAAQIVMNPAAASPTALFVAGQSYDNFTVNPVTSASMTAPAGILIKKNAGDTGNGTASNPYLVDVTVNAAKAGAAVGGTVLLNKTPIRLYLTVNPSTNAITSCSLGSTGPVIPTCTSGQVLTNVGGTLSCVAQASGSGSLTATIRTCTVPKNGASAASCAATCLAGEVIAGGGISGIADIRNNDSAYFSNGMVFLPPGGVPDTYPVNGAYVCSFPYGVSYTTTWGGGPLPPIICYAVCHKIN
ncbi:hypothetical protein K2X33_13675 [bacterium]|nr:hypothetical protein [bacterium]